MKQLAIDVFLPQEDAKFWMSLSLTFTSHKISLCQKGQKGHSLTNFKLNHQGALVVGWPGFLYHEFTNWFEIHSSIVYKQIFLPKKGNKPVFLNQLQVRQKWARWIGLPDTKKHWQFINTLCLFFLLFVDFLATLRHQCHLVSELQNSAKSQPFEFLELSSGFCGFVSVCSEWFWHTQFGIFLRQKYDDCDMFQQATTSRSVPKVIWKSAVGEKNRFRSLWEGRRTPIKFLINFK